MHSQPRGKASHDLDMWQKRPLSALRLPQVQHARGSSNDQSVVKPCHILQDAHCNLPSRQSWYEAVVFEQACRGPAGMM